MSEQDVVVAETPPPDIVERPARSSGAYKLCMECGQNVLRFEYRAGSSVCKPCEARAQEVVAEVVEMPEEVSLEAAPGRAALPGATSVAGSDGAYAWLEAACGGDRAGALTLDAIVATLQALHREQAQMIGRVTRYGVGRGEVRPEEVPLEVAAQALMLACDPLVQERLLAAVEVLQLPLNQILLGNLAYHEQDLLDQDPSLVPQASYAAQYGTGLARPKGAPARTGLVGGRLVDAEGRLVKDCLCCGREFHPQAQRPNPDFCDEYCGTFVDQLRIWATNTVLNELRYPGTEVAPQPDPRTYWQVERCQEPYLSHALQFREHRVQVQMAQAREQQQKMRGL